MDLNKVGKFIYNKRKSKELTQQELANKLCISEKTISKWECGKGFPDSSLILPLCEELEISANELLSGEELKNEEYVHQAEKNLIILKDKSQKNAKTLLLFEDIIASLFIISVLLTAVLLINYEINLPLKIGFIIFNIISFIATLFMGIFIERNTGLYECKHCNHKYIPTFKQMFFSMHARQTRYLKCPKCKKKSWSKKVFQEEMNAK